MPPLTIEDLVARAEIQDHVLKYATGIDRREWDTYRSVFADEVDIDFSSWGGEPGRRKADDWVAGVCAGLSGFDATQRSLTNFVISVDGQDATCVCYMVASHYLFDYGQHLMQSLGGYYVHKLRRGADGWRVHATTLNVTWQMGDRGLFERARARWANKTVNQ